MEYSLTIRAQAQKLCILGAAFLLAGCASGGNSPNLQPINQNGSSMSSISVGSNFPAATLKAKGEPDAVFAYAIQTHGAAATIDARLFKPLANEQIAQVTLQAQHHVPTWWDLPDLTQPVQYNSASKRIVFVTNDQPGEEDDTPVSTCFSLYATNFGGTKPIAIFHQLPIKGHCKGLYWNVSQSRPVVYVVHAMGDLDRCDVSAISVTTGMPVAVKEDVPCKPFRIQERSNDVTILMLTHGSNEWEGILSSIPLLSDGNDEKKFTVPKGRFYSNSPTHMDTAHVSPMATQIAYEDGVLSFSGGILPLQGPRKECFGDLDANILWAGNGKSYLVTCHAQYEDRHFITDPVTSSIEQTIAFGKSKALSWSPSSHLVLFNRSSGSDRRSLLSVFDIDTAQWHDAPDLASPSGGDWVYLK